MRERENQTEDLRAFRFNDLGMGMNGFFLEDIRRRQP
jgi:hypothetical protein